jgi:hypothetical protein
MTHDPFQQIRSGYHMPAQAVRRGHEEPLGWPAQQSEATLAPQLDRGDLESEFSGLTPWLSGRNLLDLVHPEDRRRARHQLAAVGSGRPQTRIVSYRIQATPEQECRILECDATNLLDDPGIKGILLAGRDITEERNYQRHLRETAYKDPLTALPNRREFLKAGTATAVGFIGLQHHRHR